MKITTIGLDLAKNVFQVHGSNSHGAPLLRKQLRRAQMAEFFAVTDRRNGATDVRRNGATNR
jgi:transposase